MLKNENFAFIADIMNIGMGKKETKFHQAIGFILLPPLSYNFQDLSYACNFKSARIRRGFWAQSLSDKSGWSRKFEQRTSHLEMSLSQLLQCYKQREGSAG